MLLGDIGPSVRTFILHLPEARMISPAHVVAIDDGRVHVAFSISDEDQAKLGKILQRMAGSRADGSIAA